MRNAALLSKTRVRDSYCMFKNGALAIGLGQQSADTHLYPAQKQLSSSRVQRSAQCVTPVALGRGDIVILQQGSTFRANTLGLLIESLRLPVQACIYDSLRAKRPFKRI